jgi:CheY-like chemotaxis protein
VNSSWRGPGTFGQQTGNPVKKHILVVDDEPPILELLEEYLTARGFRVTAVRSAAEARQVAQADAPGLVVTDLQLEDADGLQLVEQLKVLRPDLPVILLTGVLFDPQVVEERLSKKVGAYVSKTSPLKQLLQEVRRLLGPS